MAENAGVHIELTADTARYIEAMKRAKAQLVEYGEQAKVLKDGEREINQLIKESTKKYGENSEQVKKLKDYMRDNAMAQLEVREALKKLNEELASATKNYEKSTYRVNQNTQAMKQNAEQGTGAASTLKSAFTALKGLALGYAGKTLFNALIGSNAEFEQSMTSFEVLLGSAEEAEKQMENLERFAADTPLEMPDVTKAANQLLGYGVEAENLVKVMGQLGDLSQGNADKFSRVTLAYGQMLAKGKVTGEEMRQMIEAQVPLLQGLADYMQVSTAELQDMVSKGKVGIDELNGAIEAMTSGEGQFAGMMEKQAQTIGGLWSTLKDNVSIIFREMGEGAADELQGELSEVVERIKNSGDEISSAAQSIGGGIAAVVSAAAGLIKILWNMRAALAAGAAGWTAYKTASAISSHFESIKGQFKNIVTVFDLLNDKQTLTNVIRGTSVLLYDKETKSVRLYTAEKAKEILATEGATKAQLGLNAAMLLSPIGIITTAVTVLAGAIAYEATAQERANRKIEEAANKYKEAKDNVSAVESELEAVAKRIEELEGKGKLTLTEEEELENLRQSNEELGTKLILLQAIAKEEARKTNAEVEKQFNKDFYTQGEKSTNYGEEETQHGFYKYADSRSMDEMEYLEKMAEKARELNALGAERTERQERELEGLKTYFTDVGKRITDLQGKYIVCDEKSEQLAQEMDDLLDVASEVTDPEKWQKITFDNLVKDEDVEGAKKKLEELVAAGRLPEAAINDYRLLKGEFRDAGEAAELLKNSWTQSSEDGASAAKASAEKVDEVTNALSTCADTLEKYRSQIDILNDAQEEYNETGDISAQTLKKLVENDLLQYLEMTESGLRFNTEALEDEGEAAKTAAMQTLQKAAAQDIHNLAIGKTNELSPTAKKAIEDMGNAAKDAGQQTANASGGLFAFAAGLSAIVEAEKGNAVNPEEFEAQAAAIIEGYGNIGRMVSNITISGGSGKSSKKTGKSSGKSSSKASNEAEKARQERVKAYENAIKEEMRLDERWNKQQLEWGNITEKQFAQALARRADQYRYYADELMKNTDMTEAEKLELRKDYIEKAEDIELEHHKKLMSFAEDEIDADEKAWKKKLSQSEEWMEEREFYNDWDEYGDSRKEALERYRKHVEDSYNQQKWLAYEYYSQGLLSAEDYYDKLEKLAEDYRDNIKDIDHEIFSESKKEFKALMEETQTALKSFYEMEQKFYDSMLYESYKTEIAEKETRLALITSKTNSQVKTLEDREKELEAKLKALERKNEDEDDEAKRKRLLYSYEYEHDEDNRRALKKELSAFDKEMEEKGLRRELEDVQSEKSAISQLYETEKEQLEKYLARKQRRYEKNIEEIDAYYEAVMSPEGLLNSMYNTLSANGDLAEGIGALMGSQMMAGLDKEFKGWLAGALEAFEESGIVPNGKSGRGFADSVINNNSRNYTVTQNINGVSGAADMQKAAMRALDKMELAARLQ